MSQAKSVLVIALLATMAAGSANAAIFSDEAKLGANVGAMKYCEENFANGQESKYKLLRLKTLKEYGELDSDQKIKALVMRKAAEDKGEYLGDKLDTDRCDSIRKLLFLKY